MSIRFSLPSLAASALTGTHILLGLASLVTGGTLKQCPGAQLSCHNTSVVEDTCCLNSPGGQVVQTQLWEWHPSTGPEDSWTIHGLWPDNCDGTFESYCDPKRAYRNIVQILEEGDAKNDTMSFMGTYWKESGGRDASFYQHEWSKHGTCISTLQPKCYSAYRPQEEVVTYFEKTIELFKTLPSFKWLSDAGITPSNGKTYDRTAVQAALEKGFGHPVTIKCHYGELDEIWYHFNIKGSFDTGHNGGVDNFVPSTPQGMKSTCPKQVRYIPKSRGSQRHSSPDSPGHGCGNQRPFKGNGHLNVLISGQQKGFLISNGKLAAQGQPASYRTKWNGQFFILTTTKGVCGFVRGAFTCGDNVSPAQFSSKGQNLATSRGHTTFFTDAIPSAKRQQLVYTQSSNIAFQLAWQFI